MTVIFSTVFTDDDDVVIGKVFMQVTTPHCVSFPGQFEMQSSCSLNRHGNEASLGTRLVYLEKVLSTNFYYYWDI